VIIENRKLRET
jgi:hypothetical protein